MSNVLPDFLIIPSSIISDKKLQPLDGLVYGLVYWYTKLKLEKCIASNAEMARLLNASQSGVSHSLTRLSRNNYVRVVMGEHNQRKEIIPLVTYKTKEELEVIEATPTHKRARGLAQTMKGPSSNERHNNNDLIIKDNNIKKNNKKKNPFGSINSLTDEVIEEIAIKYRVSTGYVEFQREALVNYCESKGKRYKNYKAALRNFVIRSMKHDVERRVNHGKSGADARNI